MIPRSVEFSLLLVFVALTAAIPAASASETAEFLATGTVQAARRVMLSAQITGRVNVINAEEGATVEEGALLLTTDDAELQADLLAAKAQKGQAAAELKYAQQVYERMRTLLKRKSISKEGLDEAAYKLAAAREKTRLGEAQIQKTEALLAKTRLRAPFAGTITEKHAEIGQLTQPDKVLFVLEDQSRLKLRVRVRETEVPRIKLGDAVKVTFDALRDRELEGQVARIIPSGDKVHTFPVEIALPNYRGLLPGMFGKAVFAATESGVKNGEQ